MANTIAEKIAERMIELKDTLTQTLDDYIRFIDHLERNDFYPDRSETFLLHKVRKFFSSIEDISAELKKYYLFDESVVDLIDGASLAIDGLWDRFMNWTRRRRATTLEAMVLFSRSRSTIYRWLRNGKLFGTKEGRKWVIAIDPMDPRLQ
jgi:hypothetical protein